MDIYLIGCHISNDTQLSYLKKLVDELVSKNRKFVLSSHTLLPTELIEKSVGFVYDSVNPIYKNWDLENKEKYIITTEYFELHSKYISYGAAEYYHAGAIRLIQNGIRYIQLLNYDVVHWIEYDAEPLLEEDDLNNERLKSCDFVFYGIGSRFSFNINKVSKKFLSFKCDEIINILSTTNYAAEKLIDQYLTNGNKIFIDVAYKNQFFGKYSQHNNIKINWCLFEKNNMPHIFVRNCANITINSVRVIYDTVRNEFNMCPGQWLYFPLIQDIKSLTIWTDDLLIIELDLTDKEIYRKLVKDVIFKEI